MAGRLCPPRCSRGVGCIQSLGLWGLLGHKMASIKPRSFQVLFATCYGLSQQQLCLGYRSNNVLHFLPVIRWIDCASCWSFWPSRALVHYWYTLSNSRKLTNQEKVSSLYWVNKIDNLCPVSVLLKYLEFRGSNKGHNGIPLSQSRFVKEVKSALIRSGVATTNYSGHSQSGLHVLQPPQGSGLGNSDVGQMEKLSLPVYIRVPPHQLAKMSVTSSTCWIWVPSTPVHSRTYAMFTPYSSGT